MAKNTKLPLYNTEFPPFTRGFHMRPSPDRLPVGPIVILWTIILSVIYIPLIVMLFT